MAAGDALLRAATPREQDLGQAVFTALTTTKTQAALGGLTALIQQGRTTEAADAVATAVTETAKTTLSPTVSAASLEAVDTGAGLAQTGLSGTFHGRFDITNPEAVAFARSRAASLVTNISEDTQQAIRTIVTRSFTEGLTPDQTARLIRGVVGLTDRQAAALGSFRTRIEDLQTQAAGTAIDTPLRRVSNRGLTDGRVNTIVGQYEQRLLQQRAMVIARTEIMAALNEGQRQLWQQAVAAGQVDATRMERVWIVTDDEKLCEYCQPLAGETAPIGGNFPGDGEDGPPLHPNCRCTEGLQSIEGETPEPTLPPWPGEPVPPPPEPPPPPPLPPLAVTIKPDTDPRVAQGLHSELARIPDKAMNAMRQHGVTLTTQRTHPPRSSRGYNLRTAVGHYSPPNRAVLSAQYNSLGQPGKDSLKTVMHEMGHATDYAMGRAESAGQRVFRDTLSSDPAFGKAWRAGWKRLDVNEQMVAAHYNENKAEAFAEVFANVYGTSPSSGNFGRAQFELKFREAIAWVQAKVGPVNTQTTLAPEVITFQ